MQERLLPASPTTRVGMERARLVDGADTRIASRTEQYQGPRLHGVELAERCPSGPQLTFSCAGCSVIFQDWKSGVFINCSSRGLRRVCVLQTVLDLLADSWRVYVAVDAVGARRPIDHETALRAWSRQGPR